MTKRMAARGIGCAHCPRPPMAAVHESMAWPGVNQPLQCAQRAAYGSSALAAGRAVRAVASIRHHQAYPHRQRAPWAELIVPAMQFEPFSTSARSASPNDARSLGSSGTFTAVPASSGAAAVQGEHGQILGVRKHLTPQRLLRLYSQLAKNKLSIFVTGTAALGFLTAGPPVSVPALLGVTLGTYLCSAAASTCNQIYEIRNDSVMNRTRTRPLPSGRLSRAHAAGFAAATAIGGVSLLATACNPLTAVLGAANIGLYAAVYTPMKQVSPLNTEVGAIVGAIPPLMGWAACTGSITADPAGLALFGALFLWQMPHFYALAWRHRDDYTRGGYQMISLGDQGGQRTANRTMAYSLALAAFPFATTAAGVTGPMFIVEATIANAIFLFQARRFQQDPSDRNARGVFLNSLWYLPVLMVCLAFHSHRWKRATDEEEARRLSRALPAVDASQGSSAAAGPSTPGPAPVPRWLEEVDMSLAAAFAEDPASRFVSSSLSGAAATVRRVLRAHCPHEVLVAIPPRRGGASTGSEADASATSAAVVAAAEAVACPVTHQSPSSVAARRRPLASAEAVELAAAVRAATVPALGCPAKTTPIRSQADKQE